jgi:hypothetical protein
MRQAAIQNNEVVIKNILMQLVHGYSPAAGGSFGAPVQI